MLSLIIKQLLKIDFDCFYNYKNKENTKKMFKNLLQKLNFT